jgi:gluconokinase
MRPRSLLVVMGVSGSGKSTVGAELAARLGVAYAEGDAFHSPANIEKMAAGKPLDDDDRWPWLDAIGAWLDAQIARGAPGVVTCSALKRSYRDRLRDGRPDVQLVHLHGTRELLDARMGARQGHFFTAAMLDSQLAALEPPAADERVVVVPIHGSPSDIVDSILARLAVQA